MYTFLKTLHHGGIRTRNLLFCSRTRWSLCHATRALGLLFYIHRKSFVLILSKIWLGKILGDFFAKSPGWPDWANFRPTGDGLLWAVFWKWPK
jgi:hypothetical protein